MRNRKKITKKLRTKFCAAWRGTAPLVPRSGGEALLGAPVPGAPNTPTVVGVAVGAKGAHGGLRPQASAR